MRRKANLAEIERVFQRQVGKLRYDVMLAQRCDVSRDRESRFTFATVNLLNCWSNFVRSFYLSCAFGAKTKNGVLVTPSLNFPDTNAAIGHAITQFNRYASPNIFGRWHRRDEPPWHDTNTLLKLCGNLGFANTAKIQAAFSLNLRVFLDLPVARNFYAHRNQGTEEAAQLIAPHYGIPSNLRVTNLLFSNPLKRPQPLIFEWIDEIKITADFLCE